APADAKACICRGHSSIRVAIASLSSGIPSRITQFISEDRPTFRSGVVWSAAISRVRRRWSICDASLQASDEGKCLRSFSTADLVDEHSALVKSCETQFRQYGGRVRFHGQIRTVKSTEDNALVRQTLSTTGYGAVLVVDGAASLRCAMVGDIIAGLGQQNGWAGIVVLGAVRDAVALATLDIGIKALGSNPWRASKNGTGQVDVPVSFGGVEFRPGHWLYSDEDGILVSPKPLRGETRSEAAIRNQGP